MEDIKFVEEKNVDVSDEIKHQSSKVIEAVSDCETVIVIQYGPKTKIKKKS